MKTLTRISIAGALLCATAAFAVTADDTYTLRETPKVGDKVNYTVAGTATVGGMEITLKGKVASKVSKVADDGSYTISSVTNQTITMNGADQPIPEATDSTTYKANGAVSEIVADNVSADTYRLANLSAFVAPDKPVHVGDNWTVDIPAVANKGVHVKGTFKLEAAEKLGDVDALKITGMVKEAEGDTPGEIDSTFWVGKSDFLLLKGQSKWISVTVPGVPAQISGDFTMTKTD